jgi:hypothetical protein
MGWKETGIWAVAVALLLALLSFFSPREPIDLYRLSIGAPDDIAITGYADIPTKTENGLLISTKPILNRISGNTSTQYYLISAASPTTGTHTIRKQDFKSKELQMSDINIYRITKKIEWTKTTLPSHTYPTYATRDNCTTNENNETTCTKEEYISDWTTIPATKRQMLNLTLEDKAKTIDLSSGEYVLAITAPAFKKGSFNGMIGGRFFDPDIEICGEIMDDSTLINDISFSGTCFTFAMWVESVSFDGGGYTLTGTGASGDIAFDVSQAGTTISNININGAMGFYVHDDGALTVSSATVNNNITGSNAILSTANQSLSVSDSTLNSSSHTINSNALSIIISSSNLTSATGRAIYHNGSSGTGNQVEFNNIRANVASYALEVVKAGSKTEKLGIISNASAAIVSAANVTIDCGGYATTGSNTTGTYGIYTNQFNTTIKNCNISNFATGVYTTGSNTTVLSNNLSTTSAPGGTSGRALYSSSAGLIAVNNTATAPSWAFVLIGSSAVVAGNTITPVSNSGIDLAGITDALVENNTLLGTGGVYVESSSHRATIRNNNISVSGSGVQVTSGSNVTVDCQGRSIIGNNVTGTSGVYSSQFNTTVRNCNIRDFRIEIQFLSATNGTIENNNLSSAGNYNPIQLSGGSGHLVQNNVLDSTGTTSGAAYNTAASNNNRFINNTMLGYYGLYVDGGSNVSIDCQGASITGTNLSNTYGVYSNQFNTTVQNCNISNFHNGIYFSGSGSTASDNNVSSTRNSAILINSGSGILITRNRCNSTARGGIELIGNNINTTYNTVFSSTALGYVGGIGYPGGSMNSNATIAFNNVTTTASEPGIVVYYNKTGFTIANNIVDSNNTGLGTHITAGYTITNLVVANNTLFSNGSSKPMNVYSMNSIFYNNTLIARGNAINLFVASNAGNNTFYWNNFTDTSGVYVQDLNGSNYYNTTEGNIWWNVMNGSVQVAGDEVSSIPGLYIGLYGGGVPYTNSTSLGKLSCNFANCQDNAPLTSIGRIANATIWNGTAYVAYTSTSQLNLRCTNPPTVCTPRNQNSTTPIFRLFSMNWNSTVQQMSTNATWNVANLYCTQNNTMVGGATIPNGTFGNCSTKTIATNGSVDLYLYFNITSVDASFPRTFNLTFRVR